MLKTFLFTHFSYPASGRISLILVFAVEFHIIHLTHFSLAVSTLPRSFHLLAFCMRALNHLVVLLVISLHLPYLIFVFLIYTRLLFRFNESEVDLLV
jgi:hypothetical protein